VNEIGKIAVGSVFTLGANAGIQFLVAGGVPSPGVGLNGRDVVAFGLEATVSVIAGFLTHPVAGVLGGIEAMTFFVAKLVTGLPVMAGGGASAPLLAPAAPPAPPRPNQLFTSISHLFGTRQPALMVVEDRRRW
jgi:hypothetical protein